jgi:tetratricopeptide (TPR) repeat protein
MLLRGRAFALYGRFTPGVRDRLAAAIVRAGGQVVRDLTRRSDALVVGGLAAALIDGGALGVRIAAARERGAPVLGERAFEATLAGEAPTPATLLLATALAPTPLARADAEVLAAFDLISLDGPHCRFGDAAVLRTAGELVAAGRTLGETVRILLAARDQAPVGRHKLVLTPAGEAALQWDDGLTTLAGQGVLALDEDHASVDDLFEAAMVAEADGELSAAARLYDLCARADRKDALALYNLGNVRMAEGAPAEAALAYQRALGRDRSLIEARYNLAQALEAQGKAEAAAAELAGVIAADGAYADALFNLAQLRMQAGALAEAKALYERYLTLGPPDEWAATARRAILYCTALSA